MKKISIIILITLIFFTGCSGNFNSGPDKLAGEMVKRLSKGNYKDIEELILTEENTFITVNSFIKYLKANNVFIEGNKMVEVVNYKAPTKDEKYAEVTVRIDNNKTIEIDAVKKEDKWFVDLGEDEYSELEFLSPVDTTIKLDGEELDSKQYSKKEKVDVTLSYSWEKATPTMNKFNVLILGNDECEITAEKKGFEKFSEKISSSTTGTENSGVRAVDNTVMVILKPSSSEKEKIQKVVEDYYKTLFSSINNNGKIDDLKQYIEETKFSEFKKDYEKDYNYKIGKLNEERSYSRKRYDEYTFKNIEYLRNGVYYMDDNNIFVVGTLNYSYRYRFEYFGMMSSFADSSNKDEIKSDKVNLGVILKKEKDNYKISFGENLVP